ncbi:uncharacterized protein [Equus asinus]|uniref:uncharacterized protein n=1 Tax=Equus asinus TaxID=9793 RepID=UPI0038F690E1
MWARGKILQLMAVHTDSQGPHSCLCARLWSYLLSLAYTIGLSPAASPSSNAPVCPHQTPVTNIHCCAHTNMKILEPQECTPTARAPAVASGPQLAQALAAGPDPHYCMCLQPALQLHQQDSLYSTTGCPRDPQSCASEDGGLDPQEAVELGEKVNVKDVKNIVEGIGIEFTPKEYLELVKTLQVDDDGNIYENILLDGVKSFNGGKVDVSNLENILENMKIKFPDEKLKDLSQNLPVDSSGMTDLHKLLKEIKKFTGGKVEAKNIRKALGNMGIELSNRELWELLKILPITGRYFMYYHVCISVLVSTSM